MVRKNVISFLAFSAVLNAILINLKVLHIISFTWWFVFLPTWFSLGILLSKVLSNSVKTKVMREAVKSDDHRPTNDNYV
jgi:hypothetical protein